MLNCKTSVLRRKRRRIEEELKKKASEYLTKRGKTRQWDKKKLYALLRIPE